MENSANLLGLTDIDILFVAGFGPISPDISKGKAFYLDTLNLPLKPISYNNDYLLTEKDGLKGVKHFALWPLSQAAFSCFASEEWPKDIAIPQAWLEFEVKNLDTATQMLMQKGYHLIIENREEPWGQRVTRLLGPEGLLIGITITPWLRDNL